MSDTIYPYPHYALTNLGKIARMKKDYSTALSYLKQSIKIKGTFCETYKERAILYDEQALYDKAAQEYEKALNFCPFHVEALYRGATRMFTVRKEKKGLLYLRRCLEVQENNRYAIDIPFLSDCVSLAAKVGIKQSVDPKDVNKKREIKGN